MKIKEFSLGVVHYRMPNVVESMRLLGKLGIGSDGTVPSGSELLLMANLIENMQPFVSKIDASKDGVAIETWEDALNHPEFLQPLSQIGSEILGQFGAKDQKAVKRKKS